MFFYFLLIFIYKLKYLLSSYIPFPPANFSSNYNAFLIRIIYNPIFSIIITIFRNNKF